MDIGNAVGYTLLFVMLLLVAWIFTIPLSILKRKGIVGENDTGTIVAYYIFVIIFWPILIAILIYAICAEDRSKQKRAPDFETLYKMKKSGMLTKKEFDEMKERLLTGK